MKNLKEGWGMTERGVLKLRLFRDDLSEEVTFGVRTYWESAR